MKYWNKISGDDFDYLSQHEEGLKCWQTDYKLLRELHGEISKANLEEDRLVRGDFETTRKLKERPKEQKNLFSKADLAQN